MVPQGRKRRNGRDDGLECQSQPCLLQQKTKTPSSDLCARQVVRQWEHSRQSRNQTNRQCPREKAQSRRRRSPWTMTTSRTSGEWVFCRERSSGWRVHHSSLDAKPRTSETRAHRLLQCRDKRIFSTGCAGKWTTLSFSPCFPRPQLRIYEDRHGSTKLTAEHVR